jgi:hypothetical protein
MAVSSDMSTIQLYIVGYSTIFYYAAFKKRRMHFIFGSFSVSHSPLVKIKYIFMMRKNFYILLILKLRYRNNTFLYLLISIVRVRDRFLY